MYNKDYNNYASDDSAEFRGDLNIHVLIHQQIRLVCMTRNQDPALYSEAVEQLKLLLPYQQQIAIEDESEDYVTDETGWVPVKMDGEYGSSDPHFPDIINKRRALHYNPKMRARNYTFKYNEETGEYTDVKENWVIGGPHWLSPVWQESSFTDPGLLFKKIMYKLQNMGYTHKKDEIQKDWGAIKPENKPLPRPNPTDIHGNSLLTKEQLEEQEPIDDDDFDNEEDEAEESPGDGEPRNPSG